MTAADTLEHRGRLVLLLFLCGQLWLLVAERRGDREFGACARGGQVGLIGTLSIRFEFAETFLHFAAIT